MKKRLLTLNLQHFAEEKPPEDKPPEDNQPPQEKPPEDNKPPQEKPPEEKPKEPHSATNYASAAEVAALTNLVKLHGETTKTSHEILTQIREEMRETAETFKEATETLHQVISDKDEQLDKLIKAIAALVILHKQQSKKAEA